jgi:hypothetical protein
MMKWKWFTLMRPERWIAILVAIATVILTLILLAVMERASSQVSVCVTNEQRDHLRAVIVRAIDDALDDQISHLFGNWVKDPAGQPKRAQTGLNNAIKAHIFARANALAWDPLECVSKDFSLQSAGAKPWR